MTFKISTTLLTFLILAIEIVAAANSNLSAEVVGFGTLSAKDTTTAPSTAGGSSGQGGQGGQGGAAQGGQQNTAWQAEVALQSELKSLYMIYYWYLVAAIVGVFAVRHFVHLVSHSLRSSVIAPTSGSFSDYAVKPRRIPLVLSGFEACVTKYFKKHVSWLFGWSRAQVMGVLALLAWNLAFLFTNALPSNFTDSAQASRLKFVSDRAGALSIANMLLAFTMAGRNNIVTLFTGIPYENLRFVHKSVGSVCFFLGALHGATFLIRVRIYEGAAAFPAVWQDQTVQTGIASLAGLSMLAIFSLAPIRKWAYEFFLITHVLGYVLFIVGVWFHRENRRPWIIACICVLAFERVARVTRKVLRAGFSSPIMTARAEIVSGALLLRVPYPGSWSAGQHAYLKFYDSQFTKKPWLFAQSHPWSIANVPYTGGRARDDATPLEKGGFYGSNGDVESLPYSSESFERFRQEMFFIIRIKKGMTKELFRVVTRKTKALQNWAANLSVSLEGPYGHEVQTEKYETVLLFAGGSGVTHTLSLLLSLVHKARANALGHTLQCEFIWIVQDSSHISWVADYLNHCFRTPVPNLRVRVQVFVTRSTPSNPESIGAGLVPGVKDVMSVMAGRPDIYEVMKEAVDLSHGSIVAVACGPKQLSQSVQNVASDLSSPADVLNGRRQRYIHVDCAKFE